METATETTTTFTIDKVKGEFTAENWGPQASGTFGLTIGVISWEALEINGKTYNGGRAYVDYDHYVYKKTGKLSIDLRNSYLGFTDSARERLMEGLKKFVEDSDMFVIPTMDDINAEVLESAYHAGREVGETFERSQIDGYGRFIQKWAHAYNAITGQQQRYGYHLPDWPGVVDEREVKAEYLAAAKQSIAAKLERLEAALRA